MLRRTLLPALLILAAVLPAAASADVRSGRASDEMDTPRSGLDITEVRAAHDVALGTFTVTWRFARAVPDPTESGDFAVADLLKSCSSDGLSGGEATVKLESRFTQDPATRKYGYSWTASGSARGTYGSRTVTPTLSFSADRTEATVTISDPLLAGTDDRCISTSSSWDEAPYDPNQPPGSVTDQVPKFLFDGFECVERPALELNTPEEVASRAPFPIEVLRADDYSAAAYAGGAQIVIQDAATGQLLFQRTLSGGDGTKIPADGTTITARVARPTRQATVILQWPQRGVTCTAPPATVDIIDGANPRIVARGGETGTLTVKRDSACYFNRGGALEVSFHEGRRTRRFRMADLCADWETQGPHLKNLSFTPFPTATPFLRIAARHDGKTRMVVRFDGKTIMKRWIFSSYVYHPSRDIPSTRKNGEINDEYWNYCVDRGRPTYMSDGVAYCWTDPWTQESIRIK